MKKLNKKETITLNRLLFNEIESAKYKYMHKENKEIEKYIKNLKNIYEKIYIKKLNKRELLELARLIINEIHNSKLRESYESEMGNYGIARNAEKYTKTLENIYKKL